MKKILIPFFAFIVFCSAAHSQVRDTFRIFQYNLLDYGGQGNAVTYKNPRLSTIINYIKPDIFGANEIHQGESYQYQVLNNVLGAEWEKGSYINTNNSDRCNMLFWKKEKFGLVNEISISNSVRDIIVFRLYYKPALAVNPSDSVYLTVIVAHLKAGSTTQDSLDRSVETQAVSAYLNNLNKGDNYIFMGDMNVYTSGEACYSNLVNHPNPSVKLYDPIHSPGNWHANAVFKSIHTQSTRTQSMPDGGSTGGLDDRFDQMLLSDFMMNDSAGIRYLPGSFFALGQDGMHYNKALNALPANTSAPGEVIQAMYELSDHLPVTAQFIVTKHPSTPVADIDQDVKKYMVVNPVTDNILRVLNMQNEDIQHIALYAINGKCMLSQSITSRDNVIQIPIAGSIPGGIYLLKITGKYGKIFVQKVVKE